MKSSHPPRQRQSDQGEERVGRPGGDPRQNVTSGAESQRNLGGGERYPHRHEVLSLVAVGWLDISDADLEITLANGLSIGDIRRILLRLGQPTDAVRISLLDLARTGEPAIVHLERRGAQPFRHFVVFEALEGTTVVLRDPAYGRRRIHVAAFMWHWTGAAVFLRPQVVSVTSGN